MTMDFAMVRRETAEQAVADAYERGRAAALAESATRPPPPRPKAKAKAAPTRHARRPVPPKPRVIEHQCPNVDPQSSHRGHVVIGANGRGTCDWCGRTVWAEL